MIRNAAAMYSYLACWQKYASCLPEPQKGGVAGFVPLYERAPALYIRLGEQVRNSGQIRISGIYASFHQVVSKFVGLFGDNPYPLILSLKFGIPTSHDPKKGNCRFLSGIFNLFQ